MVTRLSRMARSVRHLTGIAALLAERAIDLVVSRKGIDTATVTGASLADHLDVRLGLQQAADTPADDFVVIQEEHADRLSRRIAGRLGARRT